MTSTDDPNSETAPIFGDTLLFPFIFCGDDATPEPETSPEAEEE